MCNWLKEYKERKEERRRDFEKRNPKHLMTKFQLFVRIVVGVYLFYLLYTMFKDGGFQKSTNSVRAVIIFACVLFTISGGYLIIKGIIDFKNHNYFDPNKDNFSEETEECEEEIRAEEKEEQKTDSASDAAPQGIGHFAKLPEHLQVPEDEQ